MVYINETEFTIYKLDTLESIVKRIASELKSPQKFLYFPNGIPTLKDFQDKDQIIVENLFEIIKTSTDFNQMYASIKDKILQQNISIEDLIKIFISYNKIFNDAERKFDDEYVQSYLDYIISEINNRTVNIPDILKNKRSTIEDYSAILKNNEKEVHLQLKEFIDFDKIVGIPYTAFDLEIINFEMDLNVASIKTLLELFNYIKLTDYIPFASCANFYKIRKETVPPLEWNINNDNIILKVLQKEVLQYNISDYTEIVINETDNQLKATLYYEILNNIPREKLLDYFINVIDINTFSISDVREKSINGVFYFPNQRMNKHVMFDLILNNREFSKFMSIDETIISQKPTILIRFTTEDIGTIKIFLTEKIANKKDPTIKDKYDFVENSYYVRVKINEAPNKNSVIKFQDIFCKLFITYNKEYNRIIDFYSMYIDIDDLEKKYGDDVIVKTDNKKSKLTLTDIVPELYPSNYSKFCGHQPTIITDDEAEIKRAEGKEVIVFPKDITEGTIPRNYVCLHKKFSYPGLRENTLNNADTYKYLPCCLEASQTEKAYYRNYYYGEEIPEPITDQHIITTNRFLNNKQTGYLPDNILKFFESVDSDNNFNYYRQGVSSSKNTFLSCVLNALELSDESLVDIRKELATNELAASCRQEMFDYKIEDILNKILDIDEYFNPDFFIHLLEVKYNCNIFLFKRNAENPNGSLIIPRHDKGYFKRNVKFDKCIFIYEHMGGKSDNSKYPHCELIFRWNKKGKKDDLEYSFEYESEITRNSIQLFNEYSKFYILNNQVLTTNFPENLSISSQIIDFYGKTRVINIEFEGSNITLFTDPIQPFNIIEKTSIKIHKVSEDVANRFCSAFNVYNQKNENNNMTGNLNDIKISIPLVYSSLVEFDKYRSDISEYNRYKKLSRHITQYFYWSYSKFLHDNNISNINIDESVIDKFKSSIVIIDPNFIYKDIPSDFLGINNIFANKLPLKSEEAYNRLLYLLKIELIHNPYKIISFYTRHSIENYYIETTDFDNYSSQIILRSNSMFIKYVESIMQDETKYKITNNIIKESRDPYFFKNKYIDNNVYLAQNTLSIEKAIQIYLTWKNDKYNPPFDTKDSDINCGFILYRYKNSKNIKPYYVKGEDCNHVIRIIGFKIFLEEDEEDIGKTFYTVLLPL